MANTRRVIRQIRNGEYHTFEEERWPVNFALLACAAFVAGAVWLASDFASSHTLRNGWVQLSTLAVVTGAILCVVNFVPSQRFRRAIQL